jgi:hypothetical protein
MRIGDRALVATGALCALAGGTWLITRGMFGPLVGLTGLCAVAATVLPFLLRHRGIVLGLLVLGAENGLPFLDTSQRYVLGYAISNYMVILLIALLAIRIPRSERKPGMGVLAVVSFLFTIWWVITLWHSGGQPVSAALSLGRNFLLFALLAAAFPLGTSDGAERKEMLFTFLAGALLYSIGEVGITVSGRPLSWLVHPIAIRGSDIALQRVYAFMSDSAALLFCLAIGAALLAPTSRLRRWGALASVISLAAIILQQTRAVYITLPIALVLVIVWWAMFARSSAGRLVGRTVAVILGFAGLVATLAVAAPSVLTTYAGEPFSRLSGVLEQLSSNTGNLSYRFGVAHGLLALLQGNPLKWATGLGFLNPTYHHFVGLPLGSIENADLGMIDGIMLLGLVGVILTYLVVFIPLWQMVAQTRARDLPASNAWLIFGLMVWLVQVLLASYNLGTLWQQPGQVLVAMVAALGLQLGQQRASQERAFSCGPLGYRQAVQDPA